MSATACPPVAAPSTRAHPRAARTPLIGSTKRGRAPSYGLRYSVNPTLTKNLSACAYDPAEGVTLQPYGYTGRRYDAETGMWFFRARYFDAEMGRFIARDPLGYVDGASLYRGYFAPRSLDPYGLEDSWGTVDFISHYWLGLGAPVNLEDIGLFDTWMNEKYVSAGMKKFEADFASKINIASKADCSKPKKRIAGSIQFNVTTWSGLVGDTRNKRTLRLDDPSKGPDPMDDPVYALGGSTIKASYECLITTSCEECGPCESMSPVRVYYTCGMKFNLVDDFANPLDWISATYKKDEDAWSQVYESCKERLNYSGAWTAIGRGAIMQQCVKEADRAHPPSELPFSTPYKITAEWSQIYEGSIEISSQCSPY